MQMWDVNMDLVSRMSPARGDDRALGSKISTGHTQKNGIQDQGMTP